ISNIMGASLVSGVVGDQNRKLAEVAEARAEAARAAASAAGVESDVRTLHTTFPEVRANLISCSRLYDLIVADAAPDASGMRRELLVDVLFHSSRPIVIVPAAVS